MRWEGRKTESISADEEREELETRLASDCERDDAVAANCDCLLFWFGGGLGVLSELVSVFRRRKMPDTAYETG
jgi:hypothetical protein